jgi:glycosyltransferase involved in cell wall biosynthesis
LNPNNSIGVILPTLNCASLLPGHLESMQKWLDLISEIVVVDSHSTDGTVDLIRERLQHPALHILSHPRGLYQSWNFGLSRLKTKYAYISTVGDSITRPGLEHLHAVAEQFQCDVVVSKPRFITNEGAPFTDELRWPIDDLLFIMKINEPVYFEGMKLFLLAWLSPTGAILGSSASNLYRASLLQQRSFPTDFGTAGDWAWSLANVFDYRLGVTPEIFSTFRHHPKAYSREEYAVENIYRKLARLAWKTLQHRLAADNALRMEAERLGVNQLFDLMQNLRAIEQRLERFRHRKIPWLFYPAAWQARSGRNRLRQRLRERRQIIFDFLQSQRAIGKHPGNASSVPAGFSPIPPDYLE